MRQPTDYGIFENLKWIVSDWLLYFAMQLTPKGSPERYEMCVFVKGYMRRSCERMDIAKRETK